MIFWENTRPCTSQAAVTSRCNTFVPYILDVSTYRIVPIFFDVIQPLDMGLILYNEISRLALVRLIQMQRFGYYGLCYFVSFC
jgi:hypothetical protein